MCLLLLCRNLCLLAQLDEPADSRFDLPDARLVDGKAKILKGHGLLCVWSRASGSRLARFVYLFEKRLTRFDLARNQMKHEVLPKLASEVELKQKLQPHLAWPGNRRFYPAAKDLPACVGDAQYPPGWAAFLRLKIALQITQVF